MTLAVTLCLLKMGVLKYQGIWCFMKLLCPVVMTNVESEFNIILNVLLHTKEVSAGRSINSLSWAVVSIHSILECCSSRTEL